MNLILNTTPRIVLRPITPADRSLLKDGFDQLSQRSRYLRFLMLRNALSEEELDLLTAGNSSTHVALGALDIDGSTPKPVGIARYIRASQSQSTAEIAITISDAYQGQGIGTAMIGVLAYLAAGQGITTFTALVHAENDRMLAIFAAAGSRVEPARQGEVVVTMPIHPDASAYPDNPVGNALRDNFLLAAQASLQAA